MSPPPVGGVVAEGPLTAVEGDGGGVRSGASADDHPIGPASPGAQAGKGIVLHYDPASYASGTEHHLPPVVILGPIRSSETAGGHGCVLSGELGLPQSHSHRIHDHRHGDLHVGAPPVAVPAPPLPRICPSRSATRAMVLVVPPSTPITNGGVRPATMRCLTLDAGHGDTLEEPALRQEEDDYEGKGHDQGGDHEQVPVPLAAAQEGEQTQ